MRLAAHHLDPGCRIMIERVKNHSVAAEPVGIVIARGPTDDVAPRFAAFIWGPVPDADVEETATTTKAA